MSLHTTSFLFVAALCCTMAHAADAAGAAAATPADRTVQINMPPGAEISFAGIGRNVPVKNAPYAAEIVKERQQVLGDGNQIAQRSTARAFRDSAGRTREEALNDKGEVRMVVIKDPVVGLRWVLNPQAKTATKFAMPARRAGATYTAPQDGSMHILERTTSADNVERIVMKRVSPAGENGAATERFTVRLPAPRNVNDGGDSVFPPMNPLLSSALGDMKWARQATRRELAPRDIDGVKAVGHVRSYEIPAGELGNRSAIVVSDETWYAPELQITLSSKHSDPRTGDSLFRIENLKREEPAAALFAPPSDYTVRELPVPRPLDKKAP